MSFRRLVARSISEVVGFGRLLSGPTPGLRLLMYHAIGSTADGDARGLYSLTPELFEQHMDILSQDHSDRVVALAPDMELDGEVRTAITFDDGYQDNLDVAAPILVERGLPFTIFVVASFVRDGAPGFLTPAALRELSDMPGVTIGAHGDSHVPLSSCDDATLRDELASSRHYLQDIIGRDVVTMSYPHGSASRRVRDAVAEAGYQLAVTSYPLANSPGRDRLMLGRTEILSGDSVRVLKQKLQGDWDWYRWRKKDPVSL